MRFRSILAGLLLGLIFLLTSGPIHAQSPISASNNRAAAKFPESITFSVDLNGDAEIKQVVLEYGARTMTCGTVVAKAFPQFTPGKTTTAQWTWEMKRTGSEPPGALLWWRWRVTAADGKELLTERQTVTWLDSQYPWQAISDKQANLHWYSGDRAFANELHAAAIKALADLAQVTGLKPDAPPDLYIYANSQEMRATMLYQSSWFGGLAIPRYNIVIIGISPEQMEWGKSTIAHELTHVLHLRATFTCLGTQPNWLVEGFAMYGQGGPSPKSRQAFGIAIAKDDLISVRALSSSFPEAVDKVDLSYTESDSVVSFLIGDYSKDKFMALLGALQNGTTIDDALRAAYGFDTDGLEDAWRAKIGAKPRTAAARLTPTATPTVVPTFALIAAVQIPTRTPTLIPPATITTVTPVPPTATSVPTNTPVPQATLAPSRPAESPLNGGLLIVCIVGLIVCGAIVVAKRQWRTKS